MPHTFCRTLIGKLLLAAVIALGLGLGAGAWIQARLEEKVSALRFEQPEIDLRQTPVIEGEPIDVVARLHNFGKMPIRITNLATCCGARIVPNEDTTPTEIAPGTSVPVHVRIGTVMGGGETVKQVRAEGQTDDGLHLAPAELVISAYVLATLAAHPQDCPFLLHEEELSAPVQQTVALADLWPGDGLPIKSVTSTLGDQLRYRLVPAHGDIGIGPRMLHKRYDLELSLTLNPSQTPFEYTVTITPDHPKAKPVEVRLSGKILPRCGLDTDSVAFCGTKPGARVVRRIDYHYRDPKDQEVRLVKAPAWLSASVADSGEGRKVVALTGTLPEGGGDRAEEASFEFGRDKKHAIVSVFASCKAEARSE